MNDVEYMYLPKQPTYKPN